MTRTLAISDTGLRLIKAFEGFRPEDRILVTGVRVVGYGHRLDADGNSVSMNRDDAEEQLLDDLEPIEIMVNEEIHAPLTQGQYDALCSLAFNIGLETFRSSNIVRALNNGRVLDAANGFDIWRKAAVNGQTYVVDALMRRRTAEKSLFLRNEPAVPAPSAMLIPLADPDAPTGPTDDGLPRVKLNDATFEPQGIIDTANMVNAEAFLVDNSNPQENLPGTDPTDITDPYEREDAGFEDSDEEDLYEDAFERLDAEIDAAILSDEYENEIANDEGFIEDDLSHSIANLSDTELLLSETDIEVSNERDGTVEEMRESIETEEDDTPSSVIASAADALGDRLSALLDSEEDEPETEVQLDPVKVSDIAVTPKETQRSNLVSFPRRERVLEDDTETAAVSIKSDDTADADVVSAPSEPMKRIDDLAADDVIRASRDSKADDLDPDADPVANAMLYLERKASESQAHKRENGKMWIPVLIGAALVGISAVFVGQGVTGLLNNWGPIAVTATAITGGLTLLFGLYALTRRKLSS